MKYLLLGGGGFIGTHLSNKLNRDGHSVTVVDKQHQRTIPGVIAITADLMEYDVEHLVAECDIVYFMASSVGVEYVVKNPYQTIQNNLGLAMKLVPLFEKYNRKVVFTSTSELYGNGPFSEDSNIQLGASINLRWSYAATKMMTEFMIKSASFPHVILRLFNIVGPGQIGDHGMVIPRFIKAAKANEPLVIHNSGEQVRSFCHVLDAIEMIVAVEKFNNETFNIGNDTPTTINELASLVIEVTKSSSSVVHVPLNEVYTDNYGDVDVRVPNLTKLRRCINYHNKYNLKDILRDVL